jgi:hypothetical protein
MVDQRETNNPKRKVSQQRSATTLYSDGNLELNRSQNETAFPTLKVLGYVRYASENISDFSEFHMTIRTKMTELAPSATSMLLSVACYKAVTLGVDIILYMVLEFLSDRLRKSGHDPLTIKSEKIRKTVMLSDIILTYVRGQWLNFAEVEKLPDSLVEEISALGWLPNERTMASWKQHWNLERYLEARIVPVEALLNRNEYQTAERYTAYTKGYGNDGSPANPGKTRPTPELDGEDLEDFLPQLSLQEFDEFQTAIRLIEYAKAQKRQRK